VSSVVVIVAAGFFGLCAATAGAEEWTTKLEHKTSLDLQALAAMPSSGLGSLAAPKMRDASVRWPKFKSKRPLFGVLMNVQEAVPGGITSTFPIALDQSASGAYDILLIDLDGDKRIGAGERLVGKRASYTSAFTNRKESVIDYGLVALRLAVPGSPVLHVRMMQPLNADKHQPVMIDASRCDYLEGSIVVDGQARAVRVFDWNWNGAFTDPGKDMIMIGDDRQSRVGRVARWDDGFVSITIAPDASSLTLATYTGGMGKLRFTVEHAGGGVTSVSGELHDQEGSILAVDAADGDTIEVPVGSYEVQVMARVETDGLDWSMSGWRRSITVTAGQLEEIRIGRPEQLTIELSCVPTAGDSVAITYHAMSADGQASGWFYCRDASGKPRSVVAIVVKDAKGKAAGALRSEIPGEECQWTWDVPKIAKPGSVYTVEVTIDTGPFGGKVTGTKTIVLGQKPDNAGP
jgi:hypothetical protein